MKSIRILNGTHIFRLTKIIHEVININTFFILLYFGVKYVFAITMHKKKSSSVLKMMGRNCSKFKGNSLLLFFQLIIT